MRVVLVALLALIASCQSLAAKVKSPLHVSPSQLEDMTVAIMNPEDSESIMCSGTWIAPDLVLTAAHCAGGSDVGLLVPMTTKGGSEILAVWAKIGDADNGPDVAVLRAISQHGYHSYADISKSDPVDGDTVQISGHPMGIGWTYERTIVSNTSGDLLELQGPICKGQSGSAVFDEAGEIVGVVIQMAPLGPGSRCGIGFAVHRRHVVSFLLH